MNQRTLNLVHVLIGKSIVEATLVGVLAISFFFQTFPPSYRGWAETTGDGLRGWAVNNASPGERVIVQLFIDGRFVETRTANELRNDVKEAGWAEDEWHGYSFKLNSLTPGQHEARIYALHTSPDAVRHSLQMLGNPVRFYFDEAGRITLISK